MVPLPPIRLSNALISTTFPSPTALFVGATSGIGESTLKSFVKNAEKPTVYFVGRSEEAGERIVRELEGVNAGGRYEFIKADVGLLGVVDGVCEKIKSKEKKLDLIVLSPGYLTFAGRQETKEGLDALLSLRYYARLRFIQQLLPLHPTRILSILAATNEGSLIEDDLSLIKNYGLANCANHSATMTSLAFEHLAKEYPETSFVHAFPGVVKTAIYSKGFSWWVALIMTWIVAPLLTPFAVSVEECGERMCFYATSARYPPRKSATSSSEARAAGVARPEGVDVARGKVDGAYLLNWNGEVGEGKCMRGYRERGMGRVVWEHTVGVFEGVEEKTR